jgi:hypothetical protein
MKNVAVRAGSFLFNTFAAWEKIVIPHPQQRRDSGFQKKAISN